MSDVEAFKKELQALLEKYNMTLMVVNNGETGLYYTEKFLVKDSQGNQIELNPNGGYINARTLKDS